VSIRENPWVKIFLFNSPATDFPPTANRKRPTVFTLFSREAILPDASHPILRNTTASILPFAKRTILLFPDYRLLNTGYRLLNTNFPLTANGPQSSPLFPAHCPPQTAHNPYRLPTTGYWLPTSPHNLHQPSPSRTPANSFRQSRIRSPPPSAPRELQAEKEQADLSLWFRRAGPP